MRYKFYGICPENISTYAKLPIDTFARMAFARMAKARKTLALRYKDISGKIISMCIGKMSS